MKHRKRKNKYKSVEHAYRDGEFKSWVKEELGKPLVIQGKSVDGEDTYLLTGAGLCFCTQILEDENLFGEEWRETENMPADANMAALFSTYMIEAAERWFEKHKGDERDDDGNSMAAIMALYLTVAQSQFHAIADKQR